MRFATVAVSALRAVFEPATIGQRVADIIVAKEPSKFGGDRCGGKQTYCGSENSDESLFFDESQYAALAINLCDFSQWKDTVLVSGPVRDFINLSSQRLCHVLELSKADALHSVCGEARHHDRNEVGVSEEVGLINDEVLVGDDNEVEFVHKLLEEGLVFNFEQDGLAIGNTDDRFACKISGL